MSTIDFAGRIIGSITTGGITTNELNNVFAVYVNNSGDAMYGWCVKYEY